MPGADRLSGDDAERRPGLAILSGANAPCRVHLHRRIAREIPEVELYSLFTRGRTDFLWELETPREIHAVSFGRPGDSSKRFAWRRPASDFRKGGRIIRYLAQNSIRAVLFNISLDPAMLRTFHYCRRNGVATFVRTDSNVRSNITRRGPTRWVRDLVFRNVVRRCDVAMPMGAMGQQYFEQHGAAPAKCVWVPYEPDYELFARADPETVAAFRRDHALPETRRRLLFCGRLVRVKRVDLLIDAFARIAAQRPDWDLAVAGDGPLRGELEARVPQDLRPRVRWLGFLQPRQVRLAYHASHLLVLPSDFEPWALVINEAMAAGLPVVASDVAGAAHELIADGRAGRVVRSGDLDGLTEAVLALTSDAGYKQHRQEVGPSLDAWRRKADPVAGIREALRRVGLGRNG